MNTYDAGIKNTLENMTKNSVEHGGTNALNKINKGIEVEVPNPFFVGYAQVGGHTITKIFYND